MRIDIRNVENYQIVEEEFNNLKIKYLVKKLNGSNYKVCIIDDSSIKPIFKYNDDLKLNLDYWNMLYPQAVGYSAGAIDYFIKEFEKIDKEKSAQKKLSVWSKFKNGLSKNQFDRVKYTWGDTFFVSRKIASKTLVDAFNTAKEAFIYSALVVESGREIIADATKKAIAGAAKITLKSEKTSKEPGKPENSGGKVLSAAEKDESKPEPVIIADNSVEPQQIDNKNKYVKEEKKQDNIAQAAKKPSALIKKEEKQVENQSKTTVDYVIDGDTIVLTSGEKVRYIGIDTPELGKPGPQDDECLAWVARIRNIQLLEIGELKLVKDSGADKDRYGRLLRYVYSGDMFINERLALEGLAETFFCQPGWKNCPVMIDEMRKDSIQLAYNSAEQNSRGLFSGVCDKKVVEKTGKKDEKIQIGGDPNAEFANKESNPNEQAAQVKPSNFVFFGGGGGDSVSPITTITKNPNNPSNFNIAEFEFSASEEAVFNCQLNSGEWQICFSPLEYDNLDLGLNIFRVKAADLAGNIEDSPPEYEWEIIPILDTIAPTVSIISSPPYFSSSTEAYFEIAANEDNIIFQRKLDSEDWQACSASSTISGLSEDTHSLEVKGIDQAGNVSSSIIHYWIVDATAPSSTIDNLKNDYNKTGFTVNWSGDDANASSTIVSGIESFDLQYKINSGEWQDWIIATTSTSTIFNFSVNDWNTVYFQVRAADKAGNTGEWSDKVETKIVNNNIIISDLTAQFAFTSSKSIKLYWTKPTGIDFTEDAYYDLRYKEKIGECDMLAEWDSAESKHLEIIYHNQEIEYEIKNLIKDTEYCFAIKVFNSETLYGLSNQISERTLNSVVACRNIPLDGDGKIFTQILTSSSSPYCIRNSFLTVKEGEILTIEPGVVIKFDKNAGLNIKGELIANGLPGQYIIFTSYNDNEKGGNIEGSNGDPKYGDWGAIIISGGGILWMDYAIINYTGYYKGTCAHDVCIAAMMITFQTPGAIVANNGKANINNSTISNNNTGIEIKGDKSEVYIHNSTIKNNYSGIKVINGNSIINITNSIIKNHRIGIKVIKGNPDFKISNSRIFDNHFSSSIKDMYGGIINKSASSTINAINNWWGDESGPFHPELNPNGNDYCPVSDNVEFDPWIGKEN